MDAARFSGFTGIYMQACSQQRHLAISLIDSRNPSLYAAYEGISSGAPGGN
jgi:hypothetical protein